MNRIRVSNLTIVAAATCLAALLPIGAAAQTCDQWVITPNPIFNGAETIPTMTVAFSPDSAVGLRHDNAGLLHMLWDGSIWSVVSVDQIPDLEGGTGWNVRGVVGSAPNDLWATGLVGLDNFHGVPFLAHYDGSQWTAEQATIFEDPNPQAGDPIRTAEASHVVFNSPDDIWVIGDGEDLEQTVANPVACHWDGSKLEEVQPITAVYGRSNYAEAADGSGPNSIWIVGYGRNNGGTFHMLTHYWDGSQWSPITAWTQLPGQTPLQDFLYDVVAFAPNDVWAVGKKLMVIDGVSQSVSFYLHWDGSGWNEVEGPDIGPLTSAAGSGPNDVWASVGFGEFGGRVAHWDGTSWTEHQTAPIPTATHIGLSGLATSGPCDVWAFGYWAIYDGMGGWSEFHDLIERLTQTIVGDINGDGLLNMNDIGPFAAASIGTPMSPDHMERADVNGDGSTNAADIRAFMDALMSP